MKGDFHVWFCGNVEVKFLRVTRLAEMRGQHSICETTSQKRQRNKKKLKKNEK